MWAFIYHFEEHKRTQAYSSFFTITISFGISEYRITLNLFALSITKDLRGARITNPEAAVIPKMSRNCIPETVFRNAH